MGFSILIRKVETGESRWCELDDFDSWMWEIGNYLSLMR